jgi:tRNA uridine 5-carboxymethylaminomethyl modification enzyme
MYRSNKNNQNNYKYDVVVVGAGHAGCEAALASARIGAKTLLLTINLDTIALLPCNSAIGGPGRGQIVREIDALGGEIAKNVDKTFIHSRTMNTSRGPALRTARAIVDKKEYFLSMKKTIENQENLDTRQGLVTGIENSNTGYSILMSDETSYDCKSLVLATGTFLRARIFWGDYEINAGRQGEINSVKIVKSLESMGFIFGRLRTETPPRVDRKTVDFMKVEVQKYDLNPSMFSFESTRNERSQVDSFITYVKRECIDYIIKNIKESSISKKVLKSKSPKYCPSIEDKVLRFYGKKRHPVFIQPEGINTNEMYLHGLFTTFSEDIQEGMINKIRGLEKAIITRPGYGVEYDYLKPFQIKINLESKKYKNMFFAGQINGTTGYEEAAAQGIIAGINAALGSRGKKSLKICRQDGYIGILIDDIVVRGVTEPYRMLTSRNEFRLLHRHDNADIRMAKFMDKIGLKSKKEKIISKYENIDNAIKGLKNSNLYSKKEFIEDLRQDRLNKKSIDMLKKDFTLNNDELESLIINIKYEIYFKREMERIKRYDKKDDTEIPEGIDYNSIKNVSNEAIKSLIIHNPETISQAIRLEGVRPTDILSLIAYIKDVSRETSQE